MGVRSSLDIVPRFFISNDMGKVFEGAIAFTIHPLVFVESY